MLKRFCITMAFWVLAICALGLFARGYSDGISIVLLGVMPIGFAFISLLLFYVPPKPSPVAAESWSHFTSTVTSQAESFRVDWEGQTHTFPTEPHRQFDAMRLPPARPALLLVHPSGGNSSFPD